MLTLITSKIARVCYHRDILLWNSILECGRQSIHIANYQPSSRITVSSMNPGWIPLMPSPIERCGNAISVTNSVVGRRVTPLLSPPSLLPSLPALHGPNGAWKARKYPWDVKRGFCTCICGYIDIDIYRISQWYRRAEWIKGWKNKREKSRERREREREREREVIN